MLTMNNVLLSILKVLKKHEKSGISSWGMALELRYKPDRIRYHLKKLEDAGFIKRREKKYHLTTTAFTYKGTLITWTKEGDPLLIGCEYQNECECSGDLLDVNKCRKLNELPEPFKKYFRKKKIS